MFHVIKSDLLRAVPPGSPADRTLQEQAEGEGLNLV